MSVSNAKVSPVREDKGYVLVFVLIAVALIATLATFMVRSGHEAAKQAQLERELMITRFAADGVVNALIAALLEREIETDGRGEVSSALMPEGYTGLYRIRPTSALVDINRASDTLLAAVFKSAGAGDPSGLVAAVADWRDRDNETRPGGAERAYYASAGQLGPSNRPLVSVRELMYVRGIDRQLYMRLSNAFTVWGTQRMDEKGMPSVVANAIRTLPRAEQRQLLSPSGADFTAPTEITVTLDGPMGVTFTRKAIVRLLPGQPRPFLVLAWERTEAPLSEQYPLSISSGM